QLDQVAELVDDPQAVAAGAVGGGAAAAGQVVADVAAVVDLAEQLAVGGPDVQRAAGIRVTPGGGGQPAGRHHQVADAAGGQPGPARTLGGKRPDLGQIIPVGKGGGAARRAGQRRIAVGREHTGRGVSATGGRVPVPDEHRVGPLGVG